LKLPAAVEAVVMAKGSSIAAGRARVQTVITVAQGADLPALTAVAAAAPAPAAEAATGSKSGKNSCGRGRGCVDGESRRALAPP
jgi:hypothetical protein